MNRIAFKPQYAFGLPLQAGLHQSAQFGADKSPASAEAASVKFSAARNGSTGRRTFGGWGILALAGAMSLKLIALGQAQAQFPFPHFPGPLPTMPSGGKKAPAEAPVKEGSVLDLVKQMQAKGFSSGKGAKEGLALVPLMEETTKKLKTEKDIPIETLSTLSSMTISTLYYQPAQVAQVYKEGARPFTLANLALQNGLIDHLKTRKEPQAKSLINNLGNDLCWYLRNYSDTEVNQTAAKYWVNQFLDEPDLVKMNQRLNPKNSSSPDVAIPWLVLASKDKLEPAVNTAVAALEKADTDEKRTASLEALSATQGTMMQLYATSAPNLPEKAVKDLRDWAQKQLNAPLAKYVRARFPHAETLPERLALGKVLGRGVDLEGGELPQKAMQRLGLEAEDVILYSPSLWKEDRFGAELGPMSRLLMDLDQVAFIGSDRLFNHTFPRASDDFKDPVKAFRQFNRNATTLYLQAAQELSPNSNNTYLVGLMTYRFMTGLERDFYRKAQGPYPETWGEHAGLLLKIKGGKDGRVSDEDFMKSKVALLKKVFVTGHTRIDPYDAKKKQTFEPIFDMYRWNRQYFLLQEKGFKDPIKADPKEVQKMIDDADYQKELNKRVEAGWVAFETGVNNVLADNTKARDMLLIALGRKEAEKLPAPKVKEDPKGKK